MTQEDRWLLTNPEKKVFVDLPPYVQELMKNLAPGELQRFHGDGTWRPCNAGVYYGKGYIFRLDPKAEEKNYGRVKLPVFCGKDGIYKVDVTALSTRLDKKTNRYLVTVTGMRGFRGIRYESETEFREILNIPEHGVPKEVLFMVHRYT